MPLWKPSPPSQPGFDDSFGRASSRPTTTQAPAPVKAKDKLPDLSKPVQPLRKAAPRPSRDTRQGPHWMDVQHVQEQREFLRRLEAAVAAGEDRAEAWRRIQREMWP